MKKLLLLIPILATGCSLKTHSIPGADIPFAEANYTVMGKVSHEECGTYTFGLDIVHLFDDQQASGGAASSLPIPIPIPTGSPEQERALYGALEKMPEATHLLSPRVQTETSGISLGPIILFGKRCSTIYARGELSPAVQLIVGVQCT